MEQLEESSFIKATLFGLSSSGKTRSIRTLPDRKEWLVVSAEKGLMTIGDLIDQPIAEVKSWADIMDVYRYLVESEQGKKHKGVVFDTITELTYLGIEKIRKDTDKEKFGFDEFGTILTRLQRLVRAYRDMPMNIIMLAQPKEREDETTGRTIISPALIGGMQAEYPAHFDFQLFSRYDNVGGFWITKPQHNIRTKDRTGLLPERMKPDWSFVFRAHELKKKLNVLSDEERKAEYRKLIDESTFIQ
jgi:hypothetical protein